MGEEEGIFSFSFSFSFSLILTFSPSVFASALTLRERLIPSMKIVPRICLLDESSAVNASELRPSRRERSSPKPVESMLSKETPRP